MSDEDRLFDMQRHSAVQDARISNLETKFEMFISEMQEFKQEMRERDNRRAEEIRDRDNQRAEEIRDRDNQRAEDIREIRQSLQGLQTSGRNLNIAVIIGIAAMVLAVLIK